jgi:hypothetical protein
MRGMDEMDDTDLILPAGVILVLALLVVCVAAGWI